MELNTAARVITYISKVEEESGQFYEICANRHEALKEPFISFIKENIKFEKNVKRAYYGAVSDALETGFSFKGLKGDLVIHLLKEGSSLIEVLRVSMDMEKDIQEFYLKASGLSKNLLADVSRAMARVAKTRDARIAKLQSLFEKFKELSLVKEVSSQ